MADKILTPEEFERLAFDHQCDAAYRVLHAAYTESRELIKVMETAAHEKNAAIRSLNDRIAEQDAIIAGHAKTMATLSTVVQLANPEIDDEDIDEIDGAFDPADVLSALDIPIVGQVDGEGRIVLDYEDRGAI